MPNIITKTKNWYNVEIGKNTKNKNRKPIKRAEFTLDAPCDDRDEIRRFVNEYSRTLKQKFGNKYQGINVRLYSVLEGSNREIPGFTRVSDLGYDVAMADDFDYDDDRKIVRFEIDVLPTEMFF